MEWSRHEGQLSCMAPSDPTNIAETSRLEHPAAKDIRDESPRPPKPATVLAAVNDKPWRAAPKEGAVIDRRCAQWPSKSAVGAEECQ
jgi:hypothetical protein